MKETIENQRRALSMREFAARYGIGLTKAYDEMNAGHLRTVKVGTRRLVPADAAESWFAALTGEAAKAAA